MNVSAVVTYAGYATIAAGWVAWAVFTMAQRPRYATLGGIVRRMTRHPLMRWAVWASWAFVGWHLFVRGTGAFK
jgi:hypothetical protein